MIVPSNNNNNNIVMKEELAKEVIVFKRFLWANNFCYSFHGFFYNSNITIKISDALLSGFLVAHGRLNLSDTIFHTVDCFDVSSLP
jgi:hypothetical protein